MKKITAFIMALVMCAVTAVVTFQVTMIATDRYVGDTQTSAPPVASSGIDSYIDGTYITDYNPNDFRLFRAY